MFKFIKLDCSSSTGYSRNLHNPFFIFPANYGLKIQVKTITKKKKISWVTTIYHNINQINGLKAIKNCKQATLINTMCKFNTTYAKNKYKDANNYKAKMSKGLYPHKEFL